MSRRKRKLAPPHPEEPAQHASRRTARPQAKPPVQSRGSRSAFGRSRHEADDDAAAGDSGDGEYRSAIRALDGHRYCRRTRCRREHSCTGDAQACFLRLFEAWPEETKNFFRAFLIAFREVNDRQQALKMAYARMAERSQVAALFAAANEGRPASEAAAGMGSSKAPPPGHSGAKAQPAGPETMRSSAHDHGKTGDMDSGPRLRRLP
jgi:hypothetical protein